MKRNYTSYTLFSYCMVIVFTLLATAYFGQSQTSVVRADLNDYRYKSNDTSYLCGTTSPSQGIIEMRLRGEGDELDIRVRKCEGGDILEGGLMRVLVNGSVRSQYDTPYSAGDSFINIEFDPVADGIVGNNSYQAALYPGEETNQTPILSGTAFGEAEFSTSVRTMQVNGQDPWNAVEIWAGSSSGTSDATGYYRGFYPDGSGNWTFYTSFVGGYAATLECQIAGCSMSRHGSFYRLNLPTAADAIVRYEAEPTATHTPTDTPVPADTPTPFDFQLVDNFNSLSTGALGNRNGWTSANDITITNDPDASSNRVLRLAGVRSTTYKALPATVGNNQQGTLFFRMRRVGDLGSFMGASDEGAPINYSAYETQIGSHLGSEGELYIRNGNESGNFKKADEPYNANTWYCVWLEMDNVTDTYRAFMDGGQFNGRTLLASGSQSVFQFRNGTSSALRTLYARTGEGGDGHALVDDIYIDPDSYNSAKPAGSCLSDALPTDTPVPPTDTPLPSTDTPIPPTGTPVPPTSTPTKTPVPATHTPTATNRPQDTPTATATSTDTATPKPDQARITIGNHTVAPGGSVTAPIRAIIPSNMKLGALTLEVRYDSSVVAAVSCEADPSGEFDVEACNHQFGDGSVRMSLASGSGMSGDLLLANLVLRAKGNGGTQSELSVVLNRTAGSSGAAMVVSGQGGRVNIDGTPDAPQQDEPFIYLPLIAN